MASQAQVLQEFLFKLGFQIDEVGAKKFRTGLSDTTKTAMAFGGAVIGMGVALEQFVQKFAEGMEKLYFDSRQMGASADGLMQFGSAAEQVGVSADKAQEMIKSLYLTISTQAGKQAELKGLFKNMLGVDLGDMKDPKEMFDKMLAAAENIWKTGNATQRNILANIFKEFGIGNIADLDRMLKFNKERTTTEDERAAAAKEAGVNLDDTTEKAHKFMTSLRALGYEFFLLGAKLFDLVSGPMTKVLDILGIIPKAITGEAFTHAPSAGSAKWSPEFGGAPPTPTAGVGTTPTEPSEPGTQPLGTPGAEQLHEIVHKGKSTGVPLYEGGKRHYSKEDKAAILQDIANSTEDAEELSILAREMSIQNRHLGATAAKMNATTVGGAKPITRAADYKEGGHAGVQALTVNNNFHIQGDNAQGIAGAVEGKLDRTNQNLIRFVKNNQTPNQSPVPAPAPGQ